MVAPLTERYAAHVSIASGMNYLACALPRALPGNTSALLIQLKPAVILAVPTGGSTVLDLGNPEAGAPRPVDAIAQCPEGGRLVWPI
jgi:hypothetical protein